MFGTDWALVHFVENPGMAFGITLGGDYGKLILSLFRIVAVGFLGYYIKILIDAKSNFGLLASFALILAGALGNILDSAFYGLIFSESPYHGGLATMFPEGGGYAPFLYGKVVDMLYFPMISGYFPDWLPFWGGEHFLFFKPVFNIADASITIGVLNILLFQRSFFSVPEEEENATIIEEAGTDVTTNTNTATNPESPIVDTQDDLINDDASSSLKADFSDEEPKV